MVDSTSSDAMTPEQALVQAVNRIGGQSAMGRLLETRQSTVWEWINRLRRLPAEHVLIVEAATGVSRHDLRPDVYPRGLQDDVPFRPDTLNLGEFEELGADERGAILQAPLSPAEDDTAGDKTSKRAKPAKAA